ncbi:MAG: hypothetical protein HC809_05345 [Gammaproteobacteria bacterium]|nr:hypothetical protein [Gammaproteobacteria bacterium]
MGIPCLVDVAGLLDTIEEGQRLRIDATAGTLLLLDSAQDREQDTSTELST